MKHIKLFEQFSELEEGRKSLDDLYSEKKELLNDIKDVRNDMENDQEVIDQPDASVKGSAADQYGDKLNKLEAQLEKIDAQIEKVLNPKGRVEKPDAYWILQKHIDDAKDSIKKFPERTEEESATIFKKRYNIRCSIESTISAMVELGLYVKK